MDRMAYVISFTSRSPRRISCFYQESATSNEFKLTGCKFLLNKRCINRAASFCIEFLHTRIICYTYHSLHQITFTLHTILAHSSSNTCQCTILLRSNNFIYSFIRSVYNLCTAGKAEANLTRKSGAIIRYKLIDRITSSK